MKSCLMFAFICLFGLSGHSRNFYQLDVQLETTYSNLDTGSTSLFDNYASIHYSDDLAFCGVYPDSSNIHFPCQIDLTQKNPVVLLNAKAMRSIFKYYAAKANLKDPSKSSFERLIELLTQDTQFDDKEKLIQLHDNLPESIHLSIGFLFGWKPFSINDFY